MQVLFQAFVKQPSPRYVSADVELQRKARFKGFIGRIGAIDGTLIQAFLLHK